MSRENHQDIRIGTLVSMAGAPGYIEQVLPHGFESFQLNMWAHIDDNDLPTIAKQVKEVIGDDAIVSSVYTLRRVLARLNVLDAMPMLIDKLEKTKNNTEFLNSFRVDD